MTLYEQNLLYFKERLTSIYDIIESENSLYLSNLEVIETPLNILVENENKKCFIHSIYDIDRELDEMFSKIDTNCEKLVVFGMGLGHCINYIYDNLKKLNHLIIIEPDLNIFKNATNYIDWVDLIYKIGNVTFIVNRSKEETNAIINTIFGQNTAIKTEFVYNIAYRSLYGGYYESMIESFKKYINSYLLNVSTYEWFFHEWAENAIKNVKHNAMPILSLKNRLSGIPVILVAAGPSLNYNIDYLKEVKNKAVIISVGSATKILDSNGVVPHFRAAFDAGELEMELFKGVDDKACPLIFGDLVYYGLLDQYKGDKIRMVQDIDYISIYFQKKLSGSTYTIPSGFSIANVMLDAVIRLGFKKIIFMGQDLCYTEGKLYAKGSWLEENKNEEHGKQGNIETENILGEKVYTNRGFLGMKNSLEQSIERNPKIKYINCTQRGLNIEGTENKKFTEVIKEDFIRNFDIDKCIENIFKENSEKEYEYKLKELKEILVKDVNTVLDINETRLKRLKKINKYFNKNMGISKIKRELEYIENIENQLEEIEFYREALKLMMIYKFKVINTNNYYSGTDDKILIKKQMKTLFEQTAVTKQYLEFILNLLKEMCNTEREN